MTHTPGPWKAEINAPLYPDEDHYGLGDCQVTDEDGNITIADVGGLVNAPANARLIAAAPDLLEICKSIDAIMASRFWYNLKNPSINWDQLRYDLKAAIAKAEGRE